MIVREILPNGLTLLTESMPHVRSVAIGVWLKRGSRHEKVGVSGISHFIEHMVFKGTAHRSAEVIAAQVDSIGGHMDAFTAKEYASFHLKVLDEHLPLAVDILGDIVLHPAVRSRRDDQGEEGHLRGDQHGGGHARRPRDGAVLAGVLADHPLGRPILGTKRSVDSLKREQLAVFFREVYRPANIVVAAAGHLDHKATSELVRRHFGALEAGGDRRNGHPPRPAAAIVTRSKKELEQVHLCLGAPAFRQGHEDRYGAYILNTVLGGSMSSRLFQNVREKRGLVYSISSGIAAYSDAGVLSVYAGTGLDSVDEVVRLTVEELRRLKGERLPDEELRPRTT